MKQKEIQEHYKRVFETPSGQQVLLDLERVTNTTRVTADSPNPYSAIYIVAQQQLLKRISCLLYTSPSPRDLSTSRMPSSA